MKKLRFLINVKTIVFFITFLFYLFIASSIPYMHDDWTWGIDKGITSFITADQNSRYAGNLFVLLLTRSVLFKNLAMAACFTIIPYMMVQLVGVTDAQEKNLAFLLANVLILIMPTQIWRQTYGWISGFANFVVSLPFIMGHVIFLEKYIFSNSNEQNMHAKPLIGVLLFVFAFAGQLFIENQAIYFAGVYCLIMGISLVKRKKVSLYLFAVFFGVILGTIVMFSSSLYDTLLATGSAYDNYRQLTVDTNSGILELAASTIHNFLYQSAVIVTLDFVPQTTLLIVCTTIVLFARKTKLSLLLATGNLGMGAIYAMVWGMGLFVPYRYKILFSLFYFLIVPLECIVIFGATHKTTSRVFMWLSVYGVVIPLAVTNFSGGRLLLASYILVCVLGLTMLVEVVRVLHIRKCATVLAISAAILMMIHYGVVYTSIGNTDRVRLNTIKEAVEQKTDVINLEPYKYPEYMWGIDEFNTKFVKNQNSLQDYRAFYGIPSDCLVYVSE